MTHTHIRT